MGKSEKQGTLIRIGEVDLYLSEIHNLPQVLDWDPNHKRWYTGNHAIYEPQGKGDYCLKKSVLCSEPKVLPISCQSSIPPGDHILSTFAFRCYPNETQNGYIVFLETEQVEPCSPKSPDDVFQTCISLCNILTDWYASSKQKAHANINNRNIFLTASQKTKDIVLGNPSLNGFKNEIPYYNAPEVLRGKDPDARSDVYSLGIWLYEMLLSDPERGVFAYRDRFGIRDEDIFLKAGVSKQMRQVILKAISLAPSDRYSSPRDLAHAIQQVLRRPKVIRAAKVTGICAAAAAVLAAGTFLAYRLIESNTGEIRTQIEAGQYSLAYEGIETWSSGSKTDTLIRSYIDACLEDYDYQHAAKIIPLFSQEEFDSPDYLKKVFDTFQDKNKLQLLMPILDEISGRSSAVDSLIDKIRS